MVTTPSKKADQKHKDRGGSLQMSFFEPVADWKPTPVSSLPSWKGAKRIAIDTETRDDYLEELGPGFRRGAYVVGWSFAIEGGPSFYLPYRHELGDNLPEQEVLRYLRDNAKHYDGEYVGANLSYELDSAYSDNILFHNDAKFRDIQIAEPLIDELQISYSLANIGERHGVSAKDERILAEAARAYGLSKKGGLWRLPARFVGDYATRDVTSPLEIYEKQRKILDKEDLWKVFNLETDLVPVLGRMKQRGIRIDFDKLDQIERWALAEEANALDFIRRETGVRIGVGEVWKAVALAPALEAVGVRLGRTSTGAPQIDKFLLDGLKHPVATAILKARKVNKLRTTFAASLRKYETNGRIHCSFKQIAISDEDGAQKGVRYGRLSCVDPNMQQQPSKDRDPEIAGEWRKNFLPEEGQLYAAPDYSQVEPRWTTHFAAEMDLPRAREAARRYTENPDTDNHDMMTRLIYGDQTVEQWLKENYAIYKVNRGSSKNIFLGVCYGEGGPKLCRTLGYPTRWALFLGRGQETQFFETMHEAYQARSRVEGYSRVQEVAGAQGQEILDRFDAEVPYVRALAKRASEQASVRGWVRTIMGRKLHFPVKEGGRDYDWIHKALNRVIQGSSADQTKLAMVELDRAGFYLQLQVHDEMGLSVEHREQAEEAGKIMSECIIPHLRHLWVPFKVDVEVGPSWGEVK